MDPAGAFGSHWPRIPARCDASLFLAVCLPQTPSTVPTAAVTAWRRAVRRADPNPLRRTIEGAAAQRQRLAGPIHTCYPQSAAHKYISTGIPCGQKSLSVRCEHT
eukprot:scaffold185957_cov30-Tisochrysis_lutea.AAC.2